MHEVFGWRIGFMIFLGQCSRSKSRKNTAIPDQ